MKNNLFCYATAELSQDAFICWLASYALKDAEPDTALCECAHGMLELFVPELKGKQFELENIEKQVDNIDVLLTVTAGDAVYKVIVEDKIDTNEHDDQLKKYLMVIRNEYSDCRVCGVYYKTGFQSNVSKVNDAGYRIIKLPDMLDFMSPFVERTDNNIFLDYYSWWNNYYREAKSYSALPIREWKDNQIGAFYDDLQYGGFVKERNAWAGYGRVSNPSGGFYGLWIGSHDNSLDKNGIRCELYLQIEASGDAGGYVFPIKAKLSCKRDGQEVPDSDIIYPILNTIVYDDEGQYRLSKYHFNRPKRLSAAEHMTIGVYDASYENAGQLKGALSAAYEEYLRFLCHLKKSLPHIKEE